MKKFLSRAMVTFTAMALAIGSFAAPAQAASQKQKAINSYKKYLTQKELKKEYKPGKSDESHASKDAYFSLAYIDNDKVPELLVKYTEDGDGGGTTSAGQIRMYKNGKSVMAAKLSDYNHKTLVYAKTGIIDTVETDEMGGYYGNCIKFNKGTCKIKAGHDFNADTKAYTYKIAKKAATHEQYKAYVKKLTKGAKAKKIVWHKNTKANRAKYLK